MIVAHHSGLLMLPLRNTLLGPTLGKFGLFSMSLFFVLSGFVIHYNYGARISAQRTKGVISFLFARFARLYPLYLACVLINFALNFGNSVLTGRTEFASIYTAVLPVNILAVQAWFYAVLPPFHLTLAQGYGNNAWSISVEFFLYLIFIPFALKIQWKKPSLNRGIAILLLAMCGRLLAIKLSSEDAFANWIASIWGTSPMVSVSEWLVYYSPYGRIFEFGTGIGIAEIWMARRAGQSNRLPLKALFYGAATLSLVYVLGSLFDQVLYSARMFQGNAIQANYAISIPILIYGLCRLEHCFSAVLCASIWLFFGEISYSLYLLHGNLWPLFQIRTSSGRPSISAEFLHEVAFLALLIPLAWLTYRYVEMPCRRGIMAFYRKHVSVVSADDQSIRVKS